MKCIGPKCSCPVVAHRLCQAHYMQQRRGEELRELRKGDLTTTLAVQVTPALRRDIAKAAKRDGKRIPEWVRQVLAYAALSALLASCGGLRTGGDACKSYAATTCRQAQACGLTSKSPAQCENDVAGACCSAANMHCGLDLTAEQADFNARCIDAVGRLSCTDFSGYVNGTTNLYACDY